MFIMYLVRLLSYSLDTGSVGGMSFSVGGVCSSSGSGSDFFSSSGSGVGGDFFFLCLANEISSLTENLPRLKSLAKRLKLSSKSIISDSG